VYKATDFPLVVARSHPLANKKDPDLLTDWIAWTWLCGDSFDKPGVKQASPATKARSLGTSRDVFNGRPTQSPDTTRW
jgi:hypothetical protein